MGSLRRARRDLKKADAIDDLICGTTGMTDDDEYIPFEWLRPDRGPRKMTQVEIDELHTLAIRIRNRAKARIEEADRNLREPPQT